MWRSKADALPRLTIPRLPYQGRSRPINPRWSRAPGAGCSVWSNHVPILAGSSVATRRSYGKYEPSAATCGARSCTTFGAVDPTRTTRSIARSTRSPRAIESPLGSTTARLGRHLTLAKPGFAKPRRADRAGLYFVPGACTMFPAPGSVKGVLKVVAAFHEHYARFSEPATLIIDGRIREVTGGGADRAVLRRSLRRAAGGDYGDVIHVTHGIHPAARMTGESFIEDMRTAGNDAVGLGIPFWLPGGGENHPDAIVTEQSIWVDGQKIVEDGRSSAAVSAKLATARVMRLVAGPLRGPSEARS